MIGNNMTVLMMACKEGREEFVKYLISAYSKFININQQNEVRTSILLDSRIMLFDIL